VADWDPAAYGRFADLRLRPALDLLARVPPDLPAGDVVDLGCGSGAAAAALAARLPGRRLLGVDASPAMLAGAGGHDATVAADIAAWLPAAPPALLFSNAALHWLDDHAALMPRLAGFLPPGGVLAVQMPRQEDAPSHALMRAVAARRLPGRHGGLGRAPRVAAPEVYARLLAPLGALDLWETVYLQRLPAVAGAHPVRRFTEATALRPWLEPLTPAEATAFVADYEAGLARAYPAEADGSVLFPFRRLFFILRRPAA
jgi:trans-aconitate 2-methyltransferase